MTIVYFIRHAEPNYANRDEFSRDLTPKRHCPKRAVA